ASPSLKASELELARDFAQEHAIPLRVIMTDELSKPEYFNNPANRCYTCKHTLYDAISSLRGQFPGWWILNGTNTDDHGDYRPGLQAAQEFSVHAPLAACELNKDDVRTLAEHYGLRCWDKPASPCLASRIPYGERITLEKLKAVETAESLLYTEGFPVNRVRHLGETARIEVPAEEVRTLQAKREPIEAALRTVGFSQVEIDGEGFVSGKLNRVLQT
ncbi:MAG: ATP-dependent sacrificial sulfur transferase LarE, partial [Verrucomicrobiota bacterium]